jgi:hypothetical protein
MFDGIKKWLAQEPKVSTPMAAAPRKEISEPKVKTRARNPEKSAKELATEAGEPYVAVLRMDVDPANLHQGAFELDWNEIFVARLVKAGYMMKKEDQDSEIVDRWFQNICRHVVMETWEQEEAMRKSGIWVKTTDIGGGRSEVS